MDYTYTAITESQYDIETKSTNDTYTVGLIYDSELYDNRNIANRFILGYGKKITNVDNSFIGKLNSKIIHSSYILTFGLFSTNDIKFWMGPYFGFDIFFGERENNKDWDYQGYNLSIGSAIGINFKL